MIFLHGWPSIGSDLARPARGVRRRGLALRRSPICAASGVPPPRRPPTRTPRGRSWPTWSSSTTTSVGAARGLGGPRLGERRGRCRRRARARTQPWRRADLSWAYFPGFQRLSTLVPLVDRSLYPADVYPDGQWDYYRYYTTHFETAVADLDADPAATLAYVYRSGRPDAVGRVAPTATTHAGRRALRRRAPRPGDDTRRGPLAGGRLRRAGGRVHDDRLPRVLRLVRQRRRQRRLRPGGARRGRLRNRCSSSTASGTRSAASPATARATRCGPRARTSR